jgi:threonine/homoserine/homoserine lactone efflux protein
LIDRTAASAAPVQLTRQSLWAIYRQGVITNVLNPKVGVFFLSFLPQFVDPRTDMKIVAFLFLGAVFIFNSTFYCCSLAWFAAAISRRLREGSSGGALVRKATGALFVGLGLKLAVSR